MMTRTLNRVALLFLFAIIFVPTIRSQALDKSSMPRVSSVSGKQLFRQEKTKDEQLVRKEKRKDDQTRREPRDGQEWFNRAYEFHNSDRYPEAIAAFKHAVELGYRKATSMYNIACGYSLLNDKENALVWLQKALDNGFDRADLLAEDSDLDPMRTESRFRTILASASISDKVERGVEKKANRLERAVLDFDRLDQSGSRVGGEWSQVGVRLLLLRDLDRSVTALNRAVSYLQDRGSTAMYNLACAYSLKGDRNAGIEWLAKSVDAGFDNPDKVQNDPDLSSLRTDPRFAPIEKSSRILSLSQFYKNFSDNGRYPKKQWFPAVALYQPLVQSEPNNGRAWFNLGFALHYTGEHARAVQAFEKARQLGYHRSTSAYNTACAYSMLNQRDLAFEWLNKAVDDGYELNGYITSDRDLDNLRSDPRFNRFIVMSGTFRF